MQLKVEQGAARLQRGDQAQPGGAEVLSGARAHLPETRAISRPRWPTSTRCSRSIPVMQMRNRGRNSRCEIARTPTPPPMPSGPIRNPNRPVGGGCWRNTSAGQAVTRGRLSPKIQKRKSYPTPADYFRSAKLLRQRAVAGTAVCAGSPVTAATAIVMFRHHLGPISTCDIPARSLFTFAVGCIPNS